MYLSTKQHAFLTAIWNITDTNLSPIPSGRVHERLKWNSPVFQDIQTSLIEAGWLTASDSMFLQLTPQGRQILQTLAVFS